MEMNAQIESNPKIFAGFGAELERLETQVSETIIRELKNQNPGRDRGACDKILGDYFGRAYLIPCIRSGMASRVAHYASSALVPVILELERRMGVEFHKGALFYNTAIAYLLSGNEDGCEYFLAMTDEEEVRTEKGKHKRGTMNLRSGDLVGQTIVHRLEFACKILNGTITGSPTNYSLLTGRGAITQAQLEVWRQNSDALHQFELLRVIHDMQAFIEYYSEYQPAIDNPFVMLRLAKALSHLAQWVESCLTDWQGRAIHGTLANKLTGDPHFGNSMSTEAGSAAAFAGNNPANHGGAAAVDAALQQLLADLATASTAPQRQWRILRILYIVRNSTAHTIEPTLALYNNRAFLLNLIQAVFVSAFVVCQLKGKTMP